MKFPSAKRFFSFTPTVLLPATLKSSADTVYPRNSKSEAQRAILAMSLSGIDCEAQAEGISSSAGLPRGGTHDAGPRCVAVSAGEDPVGQSERDGLLNNVPCMLGMFLNQAFLR